MAEPAKARGVRERVRAQMTEEILTEARAQLSLTGADGLSLRAISRELGMASSAIYRYFPSREALLTQLIIDAYNAVGQAAEIAESEVLRTDLKGRFLATATAVREWALANKHEYALIFGSPVPGYAAPQDTIVPATRIPVVLIGILLEAATSGRVRELPPLPANVGAAMAPLLTSIREIVDALASQDTASPVQTPVAPSGMQNTGTTQPTPTVTAAPTGSAAPTATTATATGSATATADPTPQTKESAPSGSQNLGTDLPTSLIARGLIAWTHLIGALNFELFGHRHNVIGSSEPSKRAFFDYEMSTMIDLTGIE